MVPQGKVSQVPRQLGQWPAGLCSSARRRSAAMSAPAPPLGERQTSGGRLAATDFMSTHP